MNKSLCTLRSSLGRVWRGIDRQRERIIKATRIWLDALMSRVHLLLDQRPLWHRLRVIFVIAVISMTAGCALKGTPIQTAAPRIVPQAAGNIEVSVFTTDSLAPHNTSRPVAFEGDIQEFGGLLREKGYEVVAATKP